MPPHTVTPAAGMQATDSAGQRGCSTWVGGGRDAGGTTSGSIKPRLTAAQLPLSLFKAYSPRTMSFHDVFSISFQLSSSLSQKSLGNSLIFTYFGHLKQTFLLLLSS